MNDPLIPVDVAKTAGAKSSINPFDIPEATPTVAVSRGNEWFDEPGAAEALEDSFMGEIADGASDKPVSFTVVDSKGLGLGF